MKKIFWVLVFIFLALFFLSNCTRTVKVYGAYVPELEIELVKSKESCVEKECLEKRVKEELPELYQIVSCESGFRHYDLKGNVLSSHTEDYGLFQINLKWWKDEAIRLGHDIMSVDGNFAMAKHILKVQGIDAWVCHRLLNGV